MELSKASPGWTPLKDEASGASPSDGRTPRRRCHLSVIDPDTEWKQLWDMYVLVLILYSAVSVPVQLAFQAEAEGWLWAMEVFFSLSFLTDLSLNFNVGFYDQGKLVTSHERIVARYVRGWFWIDAPSSIPVEIIELLMTRGGGGESPQGLAMLRMLRMFRLVRLLRLLKVDQYMSQLEEEFEVNLRAVRLVQLVIKLLFMSHALGCGWMAVATFADDPDGPTWVSHPGCVTWECHLVGAAEGGGEEAAGEGEKGG